MQESRVVPPLVSVKGLTKTYTRGKEKLEVLVNVNLDVEDGEFLALMGPSGSGKTTLLNMIGGLDRPDSGEIVIDGETITALGQGALTKWQAGNVGFVFQFYNLLPVLSAAQNVEVPLYLTNLSRAHRQRNAEIALELVGLADRMSHKPGELSGGQQQRVAIARALAMDPKVMRPDEPTSPLDPELVGEVLDTMTELSGRGITMLVVTHEIGFARSSCDAVAIMVDGGIIEHGPPGDVLVKPKEERSRAFLRSVIG